MKSGFKGNKIVCLLIMVIVANMVFATLVQATGEAIWYYPPTPQGNVGIRRPSVLWTFSGLSSDQIKQVNMTLDGRRVDASFRDDINSVFYSPGQNLKVGRHSVSIVITLKSGVRISSPPFSFNIVSTAFEEVPQTPVYEEVRDRINYYRNLMNLSRLSIDRSLNAAANNHVLYVINNKNAGHLQNDKRHEHFTGEMPWDRTRYFGYMSPMVAENIHFKQSGVGAVDDWMDSLYHRLPIMDPKYSHMGYGYAGSDTRFVNVLEVGSIRYNGLNRHTVVYPVDGQKGVPITWSGLEEPDPFRLYPAAKGPGGYPITLMVSDDRVENVELVSASITDGQNSVDFYSFDAVKDTELADSGTIALIPKDVLRPDRTYKVSAVIKILYSDDTREEVKKEWSFTTGGGGFETYRPGEGILVYINGRKRSYSPAPFIQNDRVLVPVRSICEELGAVVKWNPESYKVEIVKEQNIITLSIGSKKALVNNRSVDVDAPAVIYKDRTFIPLRFISEVLGYNVDWDGVMRMVIIYDR